MPRRATGRRTPQQTTGDHAEERAALYLQDRGLSILARNFRTRLGEIDLVAQDGPTLVFVEVRKRITEHYGGATGSVDWRKRRRLVAAARVFLARLGKEPPCRFDVVALGESTCEWIPAAFDLS